jgi:hypothetical protein
MESKILKAGLEVNATEQSTWGLWELTCPYDWIWMLKYLGALIPGKNEIQEKNLKIIAAANQCYSLQHYIYIRY